MVLQEKFSFLNNRNSTPLVAISLYCARVIKFNRTIQRDVFFWLKIKTFTDKIVDYKCLSYWLFFGRILKGKFLAPQPGRNFVTHYENLMNAVRNGTKMLNSHSISCSRWSQTECVLWIYHVNCMLIIRYSAAEQPNGLLVIITIIIITK